MSALRRELIAHYTDTPRSDYREPVFLRGRGEGPERVRRAVVLRHS